MIEPQQERAAMVEEDLLEALEAYSAQFGQGPGVYTILGVPGLARVLHEVMAEGKPATVEELEARLGLPPFTYLPGVVL